MKILIADDEVMSRKMLQKTLELAGYEVTAVENGAWPRTTCVRRTGRGSPCLDWVMPELDGPGVCREVAPKKRPIVRLHGLAHFQGGEGRCRCRTQKSGADDYLTKTL